MTRRNQLRIMCLMVPLLLATPAVFATPPDNGPEGDKVTAENGPRKDWMDKDLNLTEDQKKMLEANKNQNREGMKTLFQSIKEKRSLIREELQKSQLDIGKINQIQGELKELQAKMLDHRLEGILEVRKILTPEQFKKFMANMEEHKGRNKNHPKGPEDQSPR
jgi:Spy/CpxP family protein refolding chaperone